MVERHAVLSRLLPVMTMILQSWSALRVPMSEEQCRLVRVRDHWDDVCMYGHTSPSVHMLGGARLLGWKYAGRG